MQEFFKIFPVIHPYLEYALLITIQQICIPLEQQKQKSLSCLLLCISSVLFSGSFHEFSSCWLFLKQRIGLNMKIKYVLALQITEQLFEYYFEYNAEDR